jgi:hypothetical protein
MSIIETEHWFKTANKGQPIHRDDLGEENESSGTMRGVSIQSIQKSPQLEREMSNELANAPKPQPTISAPSLGLGGNRGPGAGPNLNNRAPKPPKNPNEGE